MSRAKILLLAAVLVFSILPANAEGADRAYVKIEGQKTGVFKGETKRLVGDNFISILKYNYEVTAPHDSATGQPTGRRQHMAVVITKAIDSASPQIFQAMVSNELIKEVTIEFTISTADGKEITYYKVVLTNGTISDFHQHLNEVSTGTSSPSDLSTSPMEDVSFTFQKIEVTSLVGQTVGSDSWSASVQ